MCGYKYNCNYRRPATNRNSIRFERIYLYGRKHNAHRKRRNHLYVDAGITQRNFCSGNSCFYYYLYSNRFEWPRMYQHSNGYNYSESESNGNGFCIFRNNLRG